MKLVMETSFCTLKQAGLGNIVVIHVSSLGCMWEPDYRHNGHASK